MAAEIPIRGGALPRLAELCPEAWSRRPGFGLRIEPMTVPSKRDFDDILGTLGAGSATIGGITYFNTDPAALLIVQGSEHQLDMGGSTFAQTVAGFKSADGSDFKFNSMVLWEPGTYVIL